MTDTPPTPVPPDATDPADAEPSSAAARAGRRPYRRLRRLGWAVGAALLSVAIVVASVWASLSVEGSGTPSPAAHGTGHDAALGDQPSTRAFGLAIYVDFTATADDWATYQRDWQSRG